MASEGKSFSLDVLWSTEIIGAPQRYSQAARCGLGPTAEPSFEVPRRQYPRPKTVSLNASGRTSWGDLGRGPQQRVFGYSFS
jgi:hypothetical protein